MQDTIKECIAELTGRKPAELKPQVDGVKLMNGWRPYLEAEGYTVEARNANTNITDRHMILHLGNDGSVQAVLSDSQAANSIDKPIGRIVISKATKTGERKGA